MKIQNVYLLFTDITAIINSWNIFNKKKYQKFDYYYYYYWEINLYKQNTEIKYIVLIRK